MKKQLQQVQEFHEKFHCGIQEKPWLIEKNRYNHRYELMKEEVKEYLEWVQKWDLENVAKELADILYSVYGTIIEHWLQDRMEDIFSEVHNSNMSKDYAEYKMLKWKNYFKADVKKYL